MPRIEELTDDFNELLHSSNREATVPLPPGLDSYREQNADDIVKLLGKSPLFMTSLEDAGGEDEENPALEAIRALQYDGTPAENALNFKEQGNEMVKEKKWKDAKEFYTKGIGVLMDRMSAQEGEASDAIDHRTEKRKERKIEEACLANRALCNLQLQNYRSTTLDCVATLRLNPKNLKAYYRCAQALLALNKLLEASDACRHGLVIDKGNIELKSLSEKIAAQSAKKTAAEQKGFRERELREMEKNALLEAMQDRGLRSRKTSKPPELEDAHIQLSDPMSAASTLQFPVMLLYPMHAQSDFIKAFAETDTLSQHLDYILPLPWDGEKQYQLRTVELYAETMQGGLTKVGKNLPLIKLLTAGNVEIMDELVKIYIVPIADAGTWIAEMRKRKGK